MARACMFKYKDEDNTAGSMQRELLTQRTGAAACSGHCADTETRHVARQRAQEHASKPRRRAATAA